MERFSQIIKEVIVPLVTAITAVMVVFLNHSLSTVDKQLQEQSAKIDLTLRQQQDARQERESSQGFSLKIYELVNESLSKDDERMQALAKQFVIAMTEEPLRSSFLSVLQQGATGQVREDVTRVLNEESKFKAEEPPARAESAGTNWRNWDFDIFWCSTSGAAATEQAARIKAQLESEGADGRIRVRELPESINAKAGYQVSGYWIRRNQNEETQAEALKDLSSKTLGVSFEVGLTRQATPWYISAFVCPQ